MADGLDSGLQTNRDPAIKLNGGPRFVLYDIEADPQLRCQTPVLIRGSKVWIFFLIRYCRLMRTATRAQPQRCGNDTCSPDSVADLVTFSVGHLRSAFCNSFSCDTNSQQYERQGIRHRQATSEHAFLRVIRRTLLPDRSQAHLLSLRKNLHWDLNGNPDEPRRVVGADDAA